MKSSNQCFDIYNKLLKTIEQMNSNFKKKKKVSISYCLIFKDLYFLTEKSFSIHVCS